MSALSHHTKAADADIDVAIHDGKVPEGHELWQTFAMTSNTARRTLAVLRIAFGFTFLWPFLDKLFGFGYSTKSADAWINGGNPTEGFLKFGAKGPFKDFYNSIGGQQWVNVLFMGALLALGIALILGIGMRLAGLGGAVLYVMMWTVALPPENNPVIDDHILGAISVAVLALMLAGDTWGFGRRWSDLPIVKRIPILR
ncbi:DoxX family membrane protein [soil metagenome]